MEEANQGSSAIMAAVNLAKACVGSGLLAIPYSFIRGGMLFSPLGIILIGLWNGLSCLMIIRCKRVTDLDPKIEYPTEISSSFAKIAYAALGWRGVHITNFCIIITLLGVCISYQIAFISLFQRIGEESFSPKQLAIVSAVIVFPMSCVRDVSVLSVFSLAALIILMLSIASIFAFGVSQYNQTYHYDKSTSLPIVPASVSDATSFIGVAVFCFGMSSLAFPIEESMKNKHEFRKAVTWSLIFVCSIYIFVGDGIAILYDNQGVMSNILQNLPKDSLIASFVKISMAAVCLLTYPLDLVPPAQMIEHAIKHFMFGRARHSYEPLESDRLTGVPGATTPLYLRLLVRVSLITLCSVFSAYIPCFAMVVSLLGCFTVSILSFVLPPLLHLQLVTMPMIKEMTGIPIVKYAGSRREEPYMHKNSAILQYMREDSLSPRYHFYVDSALSVGGAILCIVATCVTAIDSINKLLSSNSC